TGVAFFVDSTAPSLALTATTTNVQPTDDSNAVESGVQTTVTITATGLGAGRNIAIDDDIEGVINDTQSATCTSAADGGTATCTVTYTQNGTHHITATATEASGNVGTSNTVS